MSTTTSENCEVGTFVLAALSTIPHMEIDAEFRSRDAERLCRKSGRGSPTEIRLVWSGPWSKAAVREETRRYTEEFAAGSSKDDEYMVYQYAVTVSA